MMKSELDLNLLFLLFKFLGGVNKKIKIDQCKPGVAPLILMRFTLM